MKILKGIGLGLAMVFGLSTTPAAVAHEQQHCPTINQFQYIQLTRAKNPGKQLVFIPITEEDKIKKLWPSIVEENPNFEGRPLPTTLILAYNDSAPVILVTSIFVQDCWVAEVVTSQKNTEKPLSRRTL